MEAMSLDHGGDDLARQSQNGSDEVKGPGGWPLCLAFLCVLVAFRSEVFFAILAITGGQYTGSEQGMVYWAYMVSTSAMVYVALTIRLMKRPRMTLTELVIVSLPILMGTVYLFDAVVGRTQLQSGNHFLLSVLFAAPAAVAGLLFTDARVLRSSGPPLEVLSLVLSAAVLVSLGRSIGGDALAGVGGASYQTASYLGAVAFNISLYYLLVGRSGLPGILGSHHYARFRLLLIPLQVLAVLLSGGRGGFVLVVVGAVVQLTVIRYRGQYAALKLIGLILATVPLAAWGVPWLMRDPQRARVISRVFAYIGDGGIDWSGTSGRDLVYRQVLEAISESPITGYGIFSWGVEFYPHNIVLEFLLNGGVLYALAWLVFLALLCVRSFSAIRCFPPLAALIPLSLYPLTMLQFSGSYWHSGALWFVIACLIGVSADGLAPKRLFVPERGVIVVDRRR